MENEHSSLASQHANAVVSRISASGPSGTILHLLGYEALTYRFSGRDMRLTDVHGRVIKEILA